jgi:hypothetical protein
VTVCNGCDKTWGGLLTAHCSACHITFTGITAFDKHRRRRKCLTPESIGLVLKDRVYPCFGDDKPWDEGSFDERISSTGRTGKTLQAGGRSGTKS